jgi:hypothetical protein
MTIYVAVAIAFLILVCALFAKTRTQQADENPADVFPVPGIGDTSWLALSERIFDPTDASWLENELAFPSLAAALVRERKQLAIRWLEALQASFDQLIRTPEFASSENSAASPLADWQMLWLTLRFKVLLSYALLVVRFFGPYHRLIPSFSWIRVPRLGEAVLANIKTSH